jgi:protein TonB
MASSLGGPTASATPRRIAFGRRLLASRPPSVEGTFATGLMSLVVHVGLVGGLVYATIDAGPKEPPTEIKVIEVVQPFEESSTPPPPPVEGAAPVESDIPEFTVPAEIPIEIPPPGMGPITPKDIIDQILEETRDSTNRASETLRIGERPTFTPFEVAPDLRNRDEVGRALQREYPSLLRDAGVGGSVEVWIFLDEQGSVQNVQVNATSGQKTLDDAALRVAQIMEFSPAMNRDKPVPVWVKIPITFQVR